MKQYDFVVDSEKSGDESITVANTPKRRLDLIPRILCFLVALLVWLWMVNVNDTDVTETMILKINFEGIDKLENSGMMVYGIDKSEIAVTIQGSNRDLKKYSESDYTVTVDVSKIGSAGQYNLPMTVKTPSETSLAVLNSEMLNVNLYVDLKMTKTVPFDVLVGNPVVDHTYNIDKSANEIGITGPQSVIEKIESAKFRMDGSVATIHDNVEFSGFSLLFWDKNSEDVVYDANSIKYSTDDIDVKVEIIAQKSVSVALTVLGEGKELIPHAIPDTVKLHGAPSVLKLIDSYPVTLDSAQIGKVDVILTKGVFADMLSEEQLEKIYLDNEGGKIVIDFQESGN